MSIRTLKLGPRFLIGKGGSELFSHLVMLHPQKNQKLNISVDFMVFTICGINKRLCM